MYKYISMLSVRLSVHAEVTRCRSSCLIAAILFSTISSEARPVPRAGGNQSGGISYPLTKKDTVTDDSVSHDGKYLAYAISKSGSDWNEIHVMDVTTGKTLPDKIEWVKFSGISWLGNGFYYSRYDAPDSANMMKGKNERPQLYFHI